MLHLNRKPTSDVNLLPMQSLVHIYILKIIHGLCQDLGKLDCIEAELFQERVENCKLSSRCNIKPLLLLKGKN